MTGYRKSLTDLEEKGSSLQVELGDDSKYAVKGVGKTSFQLETGDQLHMSNVLYVPGLKKNLLSISALEDKGYRVAFMDGKVLTWPKESSIDSAGVIRIRDEGLYRLMGKPLQALAHSNVDLSELWHRRYAHIHYRALPALPRMVSGIPKLQVAHDGICRRCALGKNVRGPYPSSDNRSKGILDLVHSDVCGPMAVESMSGCLYFLTFIDDYSRKTWIFAMKAKGEVFSKFKEYKAEVENLTERKIKTLRSDNGREYTSGDFTDFCKEAGIKREYTVPYNP